MTIRDFITEAELFEHSQEYFNLIKESSEIKLLNIHLENVRFQLEDAKILCESAGYSPREGYFTESASADDVLVLESVMGEKMKTFTASVMKIFKQIVDAITSFFKKFIPVIRTLEEKIDLLNKDLESIDGIELSEEDLENLKKLVNDASTTSKAPISEKQPKPSGKNFEFIKDPILKAMIYAATSTTVVKCDISEDFKYALSTDQLLESLPVLTVDPAAFSDKISNKYYKSNLNSGITLSVDDVKPALVQKETDTFNKKLDDLVKYLETTKMENCDNYNVVIGCLGSFQMACADTIKLYTAVQKYRETVVKGLVKLVAKLKKDAAAKAVKE